LDDGSHIMWLGKTHDSGVSAPQLIEVGISEHQSTDTPRLPLGGQNYWMNQHGNIRL